MINTNIRRKSKSTFLIVLFAIVSITFGTISSSAESSNNQQTQINKASLADSQYTAPINFLSKIEQLAFLKEGFSPFITTITVINTLDGGSGVCAKRLLILLRAERLISTFRLALPVVLEAFAPSL